MKSRDADLLVGCWNFFKWMVLSVAVLLILAAYFPISCETGGGGKKAQAKNDIMQTVNAVKAFYSDFSRFPFDPVSPALDVEVYGDSQGQFFDVLRNIDPKDRSKRGNPQNARGIVFFEGKEAAGKPPKGGFGPNGRLYDPWGREYRFIVDTNYDGKVTVPKSWNTKDNGKEIAAPVIGFSFGKKDSLDAAGRRDDVTSW